jgi:hypothetical protein
MREGDAVTPDSEIARIDPAPDPLR